MLAEIIAIGTELTTGDKLDTNSQWLSVELAAWGVPVMYHTTVADDLVAQTGVLRIAAERVDWVVVTGGLGPTLDDLTREAVSRLAGTDLQLHAASLEHIRGLFARRQRPMPERNVVQAMFPRGSEPIPNPHGTAPGIYYEHPRAGREPCRIVCLPGVPSEMKPMVRNWLTPRLAALGSTSTVIRRARINCFGLGESACEEMLGDVTTRGRDPEVGITVHEATITLRIVAHGSSSEECESKIADTRAVIEERLGTYIFGSDDEELQDIVVRGLRGSRQTLSTIEGQTAGLLAHWLAATEGAVECLTMSLVGSDPAKIAAMREVPADGASLSGQPSAEQALSLARNCRSLAGSDLAVAITGAALRDEDPAKAPPHAYVAIVGENLSHVLELNLSGDPAIARSRVAKSALNLLRLELERTESTLQSGSS